METEEEKIQPFYASSLTNEEQQQLRAEYATEQDNDIKEVSHNLQRKDADWFVDWYFTA